MEQFFQQLLNGLAVGGIYALVALGYTMVYGVLKLINFAHGDLFTIGAYLGLTLLVSCNLAGVLPPVVAVLAVFIMVGIMVAIIGCLLERAAYRPLRKAGRLSAVVSALGASIFFQNAVMLVYGARFYVYPDWLRPDFTVDLFGIAVPGVRLMVIAASVILMLALWAFIQRTRIGAAVRAVAIDQGAARLMGINVDRIISLVFFIGPGLGGAAGLMVGIYYGQIDFTMGWSYGLKAFTAAILGGIGNIPGAVIGGLLGMVIAYITAKRNYYGKRFIEVASVLMFAVPGTVLGISYILGFNSKPLALTGTGLILVIVFTFRNMPVAIESGTTTLLQIDNSIEEASTILGADTGYSFRRITLPMLKNAFFSGIVYSFTKAITAVSAVIFLVSPRWKLVTSNIYSLFDLAKYGQAAAFVTMMVGILLVFIGLFNTVINLLLAPRSKVPQAKSKTEESK